MEVLLEFLSLMKTEIFYLAIIIIAVICGKKYRDYKDSKNIETKE